MYLQPDAVVSNGEGYTHGSRRTAVTKAAPQERVASTWRLSPAESAHASQKKVEVPGDRHVDNGRIDMELAQWLL